MKHGKNNYIIHDLGLQETIQEDLSNEKDS
jgi:hypothetical protein